MAGNMGGYIAPATTAAVGGSSVVSGAIGPDSVQSGNIASGAVYGQGNSGTFSIASGTISRFDLANTSVRVNNIGSGQVQSGRIGLQGIVSGNVGSGSIAGQAGGGVFGIASGTIGSMDLASGTIATLARWGVVDVSGITTEEVISGVRAVTMSLSGRMRIAMTNVSGRMPAVGVMFGNAVSGDVVSGLACYWGGGPFQLSSGLSYFPILGSQVYVGRSGQVDFLWQLEFRRIRQWRRGSSNRTYFQQRIIYRSRRAADQFRVVGRIPIVLIGLKQKEFVHVVGQHLDEWTGPIGHACQCLGRVRLHCVRYYLPSFVRQRRHLKRRQSLGSNRPE